MTAPGGRIGPDSAWWSEKRSRYHFAASMTIGRRALDVGTGSGYGARILYEAGASSVIGLDPSTGGAHRTGPMFVRGRGESLPVATGSIDVVTIFDVLARQPDPGAVLAEAARAAADDGVVLVSYPSRRWMDATGRPPCWPPGPTADVAGAVEEARRSFSSVTPLGQVVGEAYPVSELWDDPARRGAPSATSRLLNRLPMRVRDRLTRLAWNRPCFPSEYDFAFREEEVDVAHVFLLVCRP